MVRRILIVVGVAMAPFTVAQPTNNVLLRVSMVESQYGRGSMFSLDVDQREYWITAKHILTGAQHPPYGSIAAKTVNLRILNPGAEGEQWIPLTFSVLDAGKDIDIVVLAAPTPLLPNSFLASVPADSAGVTLGGECEFLGFPYGGGWRAKFSNGGSFWMPYVKRCTVSAMNYGTEDIYVLDGINNAGFSGGPVMIRTGPEQKIFAVISGYVTEPAEVVQSASDKPVLIKKPPRIKKTSNESGHAAHAREMVNVNSGFIIAYGINHATNVIHEHPIGPLRKPK